MSEFQSTQAAKQKKYTIEVTLAWTVTIHVVHNLYNVGNERKLAAMPFPREK